jgi:hypothetical protein
LGPVKNHRQHCNEHLLLVGVFRVNFHTPFQKCTRLLLLLVGGSVPANVRLSLRAFS